MAKIPTQRVTPRPDGKWQHKQDGNERATKLNPHKDKYGNRCLGRIGYFV
jgi:hypothetical protein